VRLTPEQQARVDAFLSSLKQNPYSPPGDLVPEPDVLRLLVEGRQVVKVAEGVVFASETYDEMVARLTAHIRANGKVTLAEARDMFHTSRKYAQALLEHLDGEKITRRIGDERVLY
jgi:selenocysteine-specific elongation factor